MPDIHQLNAYLGDGVYAQYLPVQGQLWLFVERCDNPLGEKPNVRIERVCLEPPVYEQLLKFAALCWPEKIA